jgi:hypothetical protein
MYISFQGMVTDQQLYAVLPSVFSSAAVVAVVLAHIASVRAEIGSLRSEMRDGFAATNQRFDDMRDLWRAELRRVEEIIDARLKR